MHDILFALIVYTVGVLVGRYLVPLEDKKP